MAHEKSKKAEVKLTTVQKLWNIIFTFQKNNKYQLPTINELARLCDVSRMTIWHAVKVLENQGELIVLPKGGIFLPRNSSMPLWEQLQKKTVISGPRWNKIKHALEEEIHAGVYKTEQLLPSLKQLEYTYDASLATVKKALESLVADGSLQKSKHGYKVPSVKVPLVNNTVIVVIAKSNEIYDLLKFTPFAFRFWHTLTEECLQHSIQIELLNLDQAAGSQMWSDGKIQSILRAEKTRIILGYLVIPIGMSKEEMKTTFDLLYRSSKNSSVLLDTGTSPDSVLSFVSSGNRVRFFKLATGYEAACKVGQAVLQLGHHAIAAFAPFDEIFWCIERMKGLHHIFNTQSTNIVYEPHFVRSAVGQETQNWIYNDVDIASKRLYECAQKIKLFDSFENPFTRQEFESNSNQFLLNYSAKDKLFPLFESVFKKGKATVWIALNDMTALLAYRFLRENQVKIGREISLVSFDNTLEEFGFGITSYCFNVTAAADAMLKHILCSQHPVLDSSSTIIDIPGRLVLRRSLAALS